MPVCQTLIPSLLCGDLVGIHVAKDTTGIIDTGLCQNQGSLLTSWPVIICSCFSIFPCNGYFAISDHLHRPPSKLDLMRHFPRIKSLKSCYGSFKQNYQGFLFFLNSRSFQCMDGFLVGLLSWQVSYQMFDSLDFVGCCILWYLLQLIGWVLAGLLIWQVSSRMFEGVAFLGT